MGCLLCSGRNAALTQTQPEEACLTERLIPIHTEKCKHSIECVTQNIVLSRDEKASAVTFTALWTFKILH